MPLAGSFTVEHADDTGRIVTELAGRPSVFATESLLSTPTWTAEVSSLSITKPLVSR